MILSDAGLGEMQIVLSTIFFGLAFVGMRIAATNNHDDMGPISFQAYRSVVSLVAICLARKKMKTMINTDVDNTENEENQLLKKLRTFLSINMSKYKFDLILFGLCCGVLTFLVSVCQQIGVETLTAGKASFINGLFVVITPIIEHLLPCYKSPIPPSAWLAVVLAVIGMYYLAAPESGTESELESGDNSESSTFPPGVLWLLASTVFSSIDIMLADSAAKRVDTVDFTIIIFVSSALIALVVAMIMEPVYWEWPLTALQHMWPVVLFVGITEGFGYTFSSIGQM
jgi:drug/metabolite transporter (DMT)-like permease